MLMIDERTGLLRCLRIAALSGPVFLAARYTTKNPDGSTDAIIADGRWAIAQKDSGSIGKTPVVESAAGMPSNFVLGGCGQLPGDVPRSDACIGGTYPTNRLE